MTISGGQCFNPRTLPEGRKIFEMETVLSIRSRKPSGGPPRRVWSLVRVVSAQTM